MLPDHPGTFREDRSLKGSYEDFHTAIGEKLDTGAVGLEVLLGSELFLPEFLVRVPRDKMKKMMRQFTVK